MECLSFVKDIFGFISQLCAGPVCCIFQLEENLEVNVQNLRTSWDELYNISIDFGELLEAHEAKGRKRTHREAGWLGRIDTLRTEVESILTEGNREIQERCVGGFFPKNCCYCVSYKLGKRVERKIKEVNELKGKIEESQKMLEGLSERPLLPPSEPVSQMPIEPITGMDLIFEEAWSCIRDKKVEIMGIHGMGGVGKTTLMKRINNKFYKELALRPRRLDFDVVIWVGAPESEEVRKMQIQNAVALSLGLSFSSSESLDNRASTLHTALSKKRFVLLLDDVWEPMDLRSIGIPRPHNNSVVIFTTRLESVCVDMGAQNSKIRVDCLDWPEAWKLFQDKVGKETLGSHPKIPAIAVEVAKLCDGLPLALITIGSAMSCTRTPIEWRYVLKNYESEDLGIIEEVYLNLKRSYDSLDTDIRPCFLYCSLFPDDCIEIDQLIRYWIGEELLNVSSGMERSQYEGRTIVGRLRQACLLKNSQDRVMMHNILRGFALWMGCECGRRKNKFLLVKADNIPAPESSNWEKAERISLVNSRIQSLGDHVPTCRDLLTLIIAGNIHLTNICHRFFQSMSLLKVLDLSGSQIEEFPMSIVKVVGLRYLNLARTNIRALPQEMERLSQLKCLDLSSTGYLRFIPSRTLSRLLELKVLDLTQSNFVYWKAERDQDDENGGASIEELECMDLKYLSITIRNGASLDRLRQACSHNLNRCAVNAFDSDGIQHFEIICGQAGP